MSHALLTLCFNLHSHAVLTLCHMLLSHDVFTLCLLYCHMPYLLCTLIYSLTLYLHCVICYCQMLYLHSTLCHIRLIDFFGINNFVILLAHKETHKLTWISPNQRDKKQIDHLLISGKWRRSLQDVRFRRGADVGSNQTCKQIHVSR